jgi:hypothetical protein
MAQKTTSPVSQTLAQRRQTPPDSTFPARFRDSKARPEMARDTQADTRHREGSLVAQKRNDFGGFAMFLNLFLGGGISRKQEKRKREGARKD